MLLRVLRKMKAVHGEVYAFHPDSYVLPTEYTKFIDAFTRLQQVGAALKIRPFVPEKHMTSEPSTAPAPTQRAPIPTPGP